ncbi:hypothetical protein [Marinobacterium rhizophilum]|uniref:hypothetical protein n=1 Tax=Marinobacterium rhizophilum TaxID=420402 RepID=UPI0003709740|nr:hypothetical protein [Marinobacterium rhizophilum]
MKAIKYTLIAAAIAASHTGWAAVPIDTTALRDAVTVGGIQAHLQALQDIADANGETRAASTTGYEDSVHYVVAMLESAGYDVVIQPFDFPYFMEISPAQLE